MKGIIKPANRQYNKLSSNYEIIVTRNTIIKNVTVNNAINVSISRYNFIRIGDISHQQTNSIIGNLNDIIIINL